MFLTNLSVRLTTYTPHAYLSISQSEMVLFVVISIGPCHPSAHGVFSVIAYLLSELILWLDSAVGLLHRSTEFLCEHSYSSHISGYLSRTDYVSHIQLESMILHICTRFSSNSRLTGSILLHLSLLANHILNVACSIGDLGCISFILWGFEDRENIFCVLERLLGARMHTWLDNAVLPVSPTGLHSMTELILISLSRLDSLLDLILLRHNIARTYGVISLDSMLSLSALFSGPMLFSAGVLLDTRAECCAYARSSLSMLVSGVLSCSFISILIRLFLAREDVFNYGVGTIRLYHGFSLYLLVVFVLQLLTGFFLVSLATYSLSTSWSQLITLVHDHWYSWVLRDLHMLGSNAVMLICYAHVNKAASLELSSPSRTAIWLSGSLLLLLLLICCFTGYVLVCGQMSYWALIVILNFLTALPVLDDLVINTLLAGTYPTDASISRVMSLHFILALILAALALLHITFIHRYRPSAYHHTSDGTFTLGDVLLNDLLLILFFLPFSSVYFCSLLIHPDNWQVNNPASTPAHIEPEVYFLWIFCLLKSRASKSVGLL